MGSLLLDKFRHTRCLQVAVSVKHRYLYFYGISDSNT
jgi:hypothetical protein